MPTSELETKEYPSNCWFSSLGQVALALSCLLTLIIKRQTETPRRDWKIWFLDVTKQSLGLSVSHVSNILLSILIAINLADSDECQWYLMAYLSDSLLCSAFNFTMLAVIDRLAHRYNIDALNFGNYGYPPRLNYWLAQVVVWVSIVTTGKMLVLALLFLLLEPIDALLQRVFVPFEGHPKLELLIVMIVIPMTLNIGQFWLTDSCLKQQYPSTHSPRHHSTSISSSGGGGGDMTYAQSLLHSVDNDYDHDRDRDDEESSLSLSQRQVMESPPSSIATAVIIARY